MDSLPRHADDLLDDIAARELATERFCHLCLDARRPKHRNPVGLLLGQPPNRLSRIMHITQVTPIYRVGPFRAC